MKQRERFKTNYLETQAGSRLKPIGLHPTVPSMIFIETEDGFKTLIDRNSLKENETLLKLYEGVVLTVDSEPDTAAPQPTQEST